MDWKTVKWLLQVLCSSIRLLAIGAIRFDTFRYLVTSTIRVTLHIRNNRAYREPQGQGKLRVDLPPLPLEMFRKVKASVDEACA